MTYEEAEKRIDGLKFREALRLLKKLGFKVERKKCAGKYTWEVLSKKGAWGLSKYRGMASITPF